MLAISIKKQWNFSVFLNILIKILKYTKNNSYNINFIIGKFLKNVYI